MEYDWSQPIATNRMEVYWFADTAGVRLPVACRLKYWNGSEFVPVPGAVAWWGRSGGASGHVAYVQAVNLNNTVTLEEYNWGGTNNYDTRTIDEGVPDVYLYPPPR